MATKTTRQPAVPITNEDRELLQDPSVGSACSFRLAALLAMEVAELFDQVSELLGHGLGPPGRATTTFPLIGSIGRDNPNVKPRGHRERAAFSGHLGRWESCGAERPGDLVVRRRARVGVAVRHRGGPAVHDAAPGVGASGWRGEAIGTVREMQ